MIDPATFKKRSDIHLARKVWHALGVLSIFFVYYFVNDRQISLYLILLAWFLFVPVDLLRQKNSHLNDSLLRLFRPIMRQSEVNKIAGTTYLLSGLLFIIILFPKPVVEMSILFLALADPAASYIGIRYGKNKIFGHKSIQGFLAAVAVCSLIATCYIDFSMNRSFSFGFILFAGLVGGLSELIPVFKIDDNFTMPVLSAAGLFVGLQFFGFI